MTTSDSLEVADKYTGKTAFSISAAGETELNASMGAARKALSDPMPAFRRYEILMRAAEEIEANKLEFIETMITEGGKPYKASSGEAERARETLLWSAEEAKRLQGESIPLDAARDGVGRWAFTFRVPVGIVCAITPSNSPLNLVAHKVGPALAAGNAVILKPSPRVPVSSLLLCRALYRAGLPGGFLSVLVGEGIEEDLLNHSDIDFYNFTGNTRVGEEIRRRVGLRPSLLELGGNSPVLVHHDADLELAAALCCRKGFLAAGQACTSVQRVYVHQKVAGRFQELFLSNVDSLKVGDPRHPETDIGPMISEDAALRVESRVSEAVEQGAQCLLRGKRKGSLLAPSVLADVPEHCSALGDEIFGPVVCLQRYATLDEAIEKANATEYGLQAAVFTRSLAVAWQAIRKLEAGGVLVNEATQWRTEFVPFGGVKRSGLGREGPRYAVEAMTVQKVAMIDPGTVGSDS